MGRNTAILTIVLMLAATSSPGAEQDLPVLARVGPWPVVSQFALYRGRLWFANSVKGVNHNSADLYTYDPGNGTVRYERHLFSQDVGDAVVVDGLLYWPFEDSRFSLGWGHFAVTNGQDWAMGTISTARVFHTHAMVEAGGKLVAATSAWRGGLQVSLDRGLGWRQVYDHPTQAQRVSRIVSLATLGDRVFGYIKENRDGKSLRRLLVMQGDAVGEVPGWPRERPLLGMAALNGWLYGAVGGQGGVAIWRTDGSRSERAAKPRQGWAVRHMVSDGERLWAVATVKGGGRVWSSSDGARWRPDHRLRGGRPHQLIAQGGAVFVGGEGSDGRGILWGPRGRYLESTQAAPPSLPARPAGASGKVSWPRAVAEIERAMGVPAQGDWHGGALRNAIFRYAQAGPPAGFFARWLAMPENGRTISLFGGKSQVPSSIYLRWMLLWGTAIAGKGAVPQKLIAEPWTMPANYPEKYFQAPPAAMWAVAMTGQKDRGTIGALIDRLGRKSEPLWLKGDAVGALTVLTGRRFAYDFQAWRTWWKDARTGWPN